MCILWKNTYQNCCFYRKSKLSKWSIWTLFKRYLFKLWSKKPICWWKLWICYLGIKNPAGCPTDSKSLLKILHNIPDSIQSKSDSNTTFLFNIIRKCCIFDELPLKNINCCQSSAKNSLTAWSITKTVHDKLPPTRPSQSAQAPPLSLLYSLLCYIPMARTPRGMEVRIFVFFFLFRLF